MLMQAQQNQQPDANMLFAMAEMKKSDADMLQEQNKQAEIQIKMSDAQAKHMGAADKLRSETALNMAKVRQGQQKLDQDFALSLTKLEQERGKQLNEEVKQNMLTYDPQTGSFV